MFVADSGSSHIDENKKSLATLLRLLEGVGSTVPVGVIVQANKQDIEGALRPRSLAKRSKYPSPFR